MIKSQKSNNKKTKKQQKSRETYDKAEKYFQCTDNERAAFEAGIKLGYIYHQFVGTPVSKANISALESAIEDGVRIQPFVEDVSVKIQRDKLKNKHDEYDYESLTGNMFNVQLKIKYRNSAASARLEFVKDLNYFKDDSRKKKDNNEKQLNFRCNYPIRWRTSWLKKKVKKRESL